MQRALATSHEVTKVSIKGKCIVKKDEHLVEQAIIDVAKEIEEKVALLKEIFEKLFIRIVGEKVNVYKNINFVIDRTSS